MNTVNPPYPVRFWASFFDPHNAPVVSRVDRRFLNGGARG